MNEVDAHFSCKDTLDGVDASLHAPTLGEALNTATDTSFETVLEDSNDMIHSN